MDGKIQFAASAKLLEMLSRNEPARGTNQQARMDCQIFAALEIYVPDLHELVRQVLHEHAPELAPEQAAAMIEYLSPGTSGFGGVL